MSTATIELSTADGPMDLYEATPDGDTRGAVIVIQEAFGVNDHIKDVTRRFAAEGYHAVAPALFHRAGGGDGALRRLQQGDAAVRRRSTTTACSSTSMPPSSTCTARDSRPADRHRRLLLWRARDLPRRRRPRARRGASASTAVASSSGALLAVHRAHRRRPARCKTPWLGLFGDLDPVIPVEDVEQLRTELRGRTGADTTSSATPTPTTGSTATPAAALPRGFGEGRLGAHPRLVRHPPRIARGRGDFRSAARSPRDGRRRGTSGWAHCPAASP